MANSRHGGVDLEIQIVPEHVVIVMLPSPTLL